MVLVKAPGCQQMCQSALSKEGVRQVNVCVIGEGEPIVLQPVITIRSTFGLCPAIGLIAFSL